MKTRPISLVRIYVREGEHVLNQIVRFLHEEQHVPGLTVLRGIIGFGDSGAMHTSSLLDLSLDLPLVIEFFDEPERAERAVEHLLMHFDLEHVVSLPAVGHAASV